MNEQFNLTVNPTKLVDTHFAHRISYNLIYYIIMNYNTIDNTVKLPVSMIRTKYHSSYGLVKKAIGQLVEKGFIYPITSKPDCYTLNNKVFLKIVPITINK